MATTSASASSRQPAKALAVTSVSTAQYDPESSAKEAVPACQEWALTQRQAQTFFEAAEEIDMRAYYHDYDTAPCMVAGTLSALRKTWNFTINGAGKGTLVRDDEKRYFGCKSSTCQALSMWPDEGTGE